MENFIARKKKYLKRLTQYADVVMRLLCNNDTIREAAVLMEPRNNEELDFAISTLDFIDDMDNLLENIMLGHVEEIDAEESLFVNYIAAMLNIIDDCIDPEIIEKKMDEFCQSCIPDEEEFLANIKYEFTILSLTDPIKLLAAIEKKSGYNLNDKYIRLKIDFIHNILEKQNLEDDRDYSKITKMNKKFHERCERGINEYTTSTVDKMIGEIFGGNEDDSKRVYKK